MDIVQDGISRQLVQESILGIHIFTHHIHLYRMPGFEWVTPEGLTHVHHASLLAMAVTIVVLAFIDLKNHVSVLQIHSVLVSENLHR